MNKITYGVMKGHLTNSNRRRVKYSRLLGIALLVLALSGCDQPLLGPNFIREPIGNFTCSIPDSAHGIDISYHNGPIDWSELKRKEPQIEFVFIRATVGLKEDVDYQDYLDGARKIGLQTGAYHYYWSNVNSTIQFKNFKRSVSMSKHDLYPVLDVEKPSKYGDENLRKGVLNWLKLAEEEYGVKPILYTNMYFYNEHLRGYFNEYPKWIAAYSRCPSSIDWDVHQYSETGKVDGIDAAVDLNYCSSQFLTQIKLPH